jgi:hypothetical protein
LSDATEQGATGAAEPIDSAGDDRSDVIATVATVAVVGIGAAAFEAALLPRIVLDGTRASPRLDRCAVNPVPQ